MKEYKTLQFVSHLTVVLGWIIIVFGWVFGYVVGQALGGVNETLFSDGPPIEIRNNRYAEFIMVTVGIFSTVQGLFMIAAGQVFLVLLDIRNDIHAHLNITRRFMVWYQKNKILIEDDEDDDEEA